MRKILFVYAWLSLTLVGLAAADHAVYMYSKYQRAVILLEYYEYRVDRLERLMRANEEIFKRLDAERVELHAWRVHITVASRQGWFVASRYIREYPLQFEYESPVGGGPERIAIGYSIVP